MIGKRKIKSLKITYQQIYQQMQLQKETNRNKLETLLLDKDFFWYKN